ncbi:MAG: tail protein X [Blautia sp.]|nr:tail protein X [Blautia sp.]
MTTKFYTYTTKDGDSFDLIALKYYNEEKHATRLIEANPDYADVIIFNGGVNLIIPVISDVEKIETVPPWRR